jgi:hypothetical protein
MLMEVDLTENVMSRLKVHRALERTAAEKPLSGAPAVGV